MIGIYGSNGFIGRHLVKRLASLGIKTRAISRKHDLKFIAGIRGAVEFVEADINDSLAMTSSLQDIDTVVQMISTSSPSFKNDHASADVQENVVPHVSFLHNCIRAGVKRYVFLSSGGTIYGPGAIVPTPESAPENPICSHGLTKLCVEKYIRMYGQVDGLEYVILRLANPFGPDQHYRKGQGLIPALLERRRNGFPVRIIGDGSAKRDFVYIDDVIDALLLALKTKSATRAVVNIGSGEPRSILNVLETIEHQLQLTFEREYVGARPTDVDISWLDISLARSLLGWSPATSFEEGIRRTLQSSDFPQQFA